MNPIKSNTINLINKLFISKYGLNTNRKIRGVIVVAMLENVTPRPAAELLTT